MDQSRGKPLTPAQNSTTCPVAANPPTPTGHPSDEGVFKAALSLKGGTQLEAKRLPTFAENSENQNERPHPRFHQRPERVPKEGVEFSGDWTALSGCVSTTNATGWMPCLALPPW